MSVWRSSSTGCHPPRACPGPTSRPGWGTDRSRLLGLLAAAALAMPALLAAPGALSATAAPAAGDSSSHVQPVPRLEVLVLADGWVLRLSDPLSRGWGPPLDEREVRRLGPGRAYIPSSSEASERVLLATASELLGGTLGVLQLRAGDRVPWRSLVRAAEILGPVRLGEPLGDSLDGVLVDARPST